MEDCFSVYCIHCSKDLSGGDLVTGLHVNSLHLCIKGEVVSVLDKDTLVIAREDGYLADGAVEDGLDLCVRGDGYGDSVIVRKLQVLVNCVVLLAELGHYRAFGRPGQFAAVGDELFCKSVVYRRGGSLGCALDGRGYGLLDFGLQSLGLFLFLVAGTLVIISKSISLKYVFFIADTIAPAKLFELNLTPLNL